MMLPYVVNILLRRNLAALTFMLSLATVAHLPAQDGSLDQGFLTGTGANHTVNVVSALPDGKIFIGGILTSFGGAPAPRLARLHPDGSPDMGFVPTMANLGANGDIRSLGIQNDGKYIIGGVFTQYGGQNVGRIVRLDTNGLTDAAFQHTPGANNEVLAIEPQADGRILISGFFSSYHGQAFNGFTRLMPNGSIDSSFLVGNGSNLSPIVIRALPGGKILIGGTFVSYQGQPIQRIARLHANGTLDTSFVPASIPSGGINRMEVQPDGRIIIAGTFASVGGVTVNRIARLMPDGQRDTSFQPGTGVNSTIRSLALQSDGKIIIGGDFTMLNGQSRARIARLHPDGSLDTGFDPGTGTNGSVMDISLQTDGKPIIAGAFTIFNNISRQRIARLNNAYCLNDTLPPIPDIAQLPVMTVSCGTAITNYPTATDNCSGVLSATTNDPLMYTSGGMYTVVWIYTDNAGNTSTQTQSIQITGIDVTASIHSGLADTLKANYLSPGATYHFYACSGGILLPLSSGPQPYFVCPAPGDYAMSISEGLCSDTSACYTLLLTHVAEAEVTPDIKVFPQPAMDVLELHHPAAKGSMYRIFSNAGRLIKEGLCGKNGQTRIDIRSLRPGIYILGVYPAHGVDHILFIKT